jgi:Cadherin domain/FG-GAP-like repeat/NHL repeat/Calx-beta domain
MKKLSFLLVLLASLTSMAQNPATLPIGAKGPGGGFIYYDKGDWDNGWRYLESAPTKWNGTDAVDPKSTFGANISNNTSIEIGTGKANTLTIGTSSNFYGLISTYNRRKGNMGDWFLPSLKELEELAKFYGLTVENKFIFGSPVNTSDYTLQSFWSSSQSGSQVASASRVNFFTGVTAIDDKTSNFSIRPSRYVTKADLDPTVKKEVQSNAPSILLLKNQSAIIQFPESTLTSAVFKISSLSTKGKLYQLNADLTTGAEITTVNTAISNADRKVLFVPTTGESGNDYSEFSFTVSNDATTESAVKVLISVQDSDSDNDGILNIYELVNGSNSLFAESQVSISAIANPVIPETSGTKDVVATISAASTKDVIVDLRLTGTAADQKDYKYDYAKLGQTTFLAGGLEGFANSTTATDAKFSYIRGINSDDKGNVYVVDHNNNRIRKIDPAGIVTTFVGGGNQSFKDGKGADAELSSPEFLEKDTEGNFYFVDGGSRNIVRKVTPSGLVTTIAGNLSVNTNQNGTGTNATFSNIRDLKLDAQNNIYVLVQTQGSGFTNSYIRKITPAAVVTNYHKIVNRYISTFDLAADGTIFYSNGGSIIKSAVDSTGSAPETFVYTGLNSAKDSWNGWYTNYLRMGKDGQLYIDLGGSYEKHNIIKFTSTPESNGGNPISPTFLTANFANNNNARVEDMRFTISANGDILYADKYADLIAEKVYSKVNRIDFGPKIIIPAGSTSGKITINTVDDESDEEDETVILTPIVAQNGAIGANSAKTLTITDNDTAPVISFKFSAPFITENSTKEVDLVAYTSVVSGKTLSITFNTTGSTVSETTKFVVDKKTITIPAGSPSGKLTISTKDLNDATIEEVKKIVFNVVGTVANASVASNTVSLDYQSDDDPSATFALGASSITESGSTSLTVTLSQKAARDAVFDINLRGTASKEVDYEAIFESKGTGSIVAGGNGRGGANNQLNDPLGVFVTSNGTVYVGTSDNPKVTKWAPGDTIGTVVAGGNGWGNGLNQLGSIWGVFVAANNDVYVTDHNNHRVMKWASGATAGVVVAGGNGEGDAANQLRWPTGVFVDSEESVYVADRNNNRVQKWAKGATTGTTVAGGLTFNDNNNTNQLSNPQGLYVDGSRNVYVTTNWNHAVQKWAPNATQPTIVAGGNWYGSQSNQLADVQGIYVDNLGTVYVADQNNHRVQKWLAGANEGITIAGINGNSSSELGKLNSPSAVSFDGLGNLYVAERNNHRVQKIQLSPQVRVPAGSLTGSLTLKGMRDAVSDPNETAIVSILSASNATYSSTVSTTLTINDSDPVPSVSFVLSNTKITENSDTDVILTARTSVASSSVISITFNTTGSTASLTSEFVLGANSIVIPTGQTSGTLTISTRGLTDAEVEPLEDIILNVATIENATASNRSVTLKLESTNNPSAAISLGSASIAESDSTNVIFTLSSRASRDVEIEVDLSGTAVVDKDFTLDFPGKGNAKTVAGGNGNGQELNKVSDPLGLFVTSNGTVYTNSQNNTKVTRWAPGATTGTLVAGGNGWGNALNKFGNVWGVYVASNGDVYATDHNNHRVVKWAPAATQGVVVAGGNGEGSEANQLRWPTGVYVDADENVYVADRNNNRVQKWAKNATSGTTVAGGSDFNNGNNVNVLNNPQGIFVDADKNLYVTSGWNHAVQKWAPGATQPTIVAGGNWYGSAANQLADPSGIYVDADKNVYVSERDNHRVTKWAPGAKTGKIVAGGQGDGSSVAKLSRPSGVALDAAGNIYVSDQGNHRVQKFLKNPIVTIKAGELTGQVQVKGVNDLTDEENKTLILTPTTATNVTLSSTASNTITIVDNDTAPVVSYKFSSPTIVENSATDIVLTATPSIVSDKDITILFETSGTAVASSEYTVSSSTITIAKGQSSGTLTISTRNLNDTTVEPLESIVFAVKTITNATSSTNTITTYVESDDAPTYSIASSKATVTEKNSTQEIEVKLPTASSRDVTVELDLGGTAKLVKDYAIDFDGKGESKVVAGGKGDGGEANKVGSPWGVSVLADGTVFVSSQNNAKVTRWAPGDTTGTIVAGDDWTQGQNNLIRNPMGIFVDKDENLYAISGFANSIVKYTKGSRVGTIIAGNQGSGNEANQFSNPQGLFVDAAGSIYVADRNNDRIQKWAKNSSGAYTTGVTVAGGTTYNTASNDAKLHNPGAVFVDKDGNVYAASNWNHSVQKWAPGATKPVIVAGGNWWGNNANQLANPEAIYVDDDGNVFVGEGGNGRVTKWAPGATTGEVVASGINNLTGMSFDGKGNLYVVERNNHRVLRFLLNPQIVVKAGELSGKATITTIDDVIDEEDETITITGKNVVNATAGATISSTLTIADDDDAPVVKLSLSSPKISENATADIVLTASLSAIVDAGTASKTVTPTYTSPGATPYVAPTVSGKDITLTLVVSGTASETSEFKVSAKEIKIAKGASSGTITISTKGLDDTTVEVLESIKFKVSAITNAAIATDSIIAYIDSDDNPVVTLSTELKDFPEHKSTSILAKLSAPSSRDAVMSFTFSGTSTFDQDYSVDFPGKGSTKVVAGGNGQGSQLNKVDYPEGMFVVPNGTVYVSTNNNPRVMRWAPGDTTGTVVAGGNWWGTELNQLQNPRGIYVDANENVYVIDNQSNRVVKWAKNATAGVVVAGGNGSGNALNQIGNSSSVFVDGSGNIFIADNANNRVVKWAPNARTGTLVAGGDAYNTALSNTDNNLRLNWPQGLFVDGAGNVFVTTNHNHAVQKWAPGATKPTVVAGGNWYGSAPNQLGDPQGIYVDAKGNIYVAEAANSRITKWAPNSNVGVVVATGLSQANGIGFDAAGNMYATDRMNHRVLKYQISPQIVIPAGESEAKLTIQGIDEDVDEEDETIIAKVGSATGADLNSTSELSLKILDNNTTLTLKENPFVGLGNGAVAWGDYDRDGDQDVAVMGESATTGAVTSIYQNNKGVFKNINQNIAFLTDGDLSWVDINKDGFIDLVVSGYNNKPQTHLYLNVNGEYFDATNDYGLPQLYSSKMAWGDLDNDGDIDLAISGLDEKDQFQFYLCFKEDGKDNFIIENGNLSANGGMMMNTNGANQGAQGFINGDLKIVDYDLDGDNDIIYSGQASSGTSVGGLWLNTYIPTPVSTNNNNNNNNGNYTPIQWNLLNSSLVVANFGANAQRKLTVLNSGEDDKGNIILTTNNGPALGINTVWDNVAQKWVTTSQYGFPVLKNGEIAVGDFNNDGKDDLVFTGEDSKGVPQTKLFIQTAEGGFKASPIELKGLRNSTADWVDYDTDGDLDLFITGLDDKGAKTLLYEADIKYNKNEAPAAISGLKSENLGNGKVRLSWTAPKDDHSTTNLGYVVRLGTSKGGSELSNTESDLETGTRLIVKTAPIYTNFFETQLDPGNYYWSVQAVDNGLKGGQFAVEDKFQLLYDWKVLNQGGIIDRSITALANPVIKLVDVDNDKDLDLIYGSSSQQMAPKLMKFDSKRLATDNTNPLNSVDKITNAQTGDINGDGKPDVVINNMFGSSYGIKVFMTIPTSTNSGTNTSTTPPAPTPGNSGIYNVKDLGNGLFKAKSRVVDLNNDGQAEVVVAGLTSSFASGKFNLLVYSFDKKTGNFVSTDLSSQIATLNSAVFDLGDIDNDQDIDLIVSGFSSSGGYKSYVYKNTTTLGGAFTLTVTADNLIAVKDGSADLIDFDSDGDLDAVISGTSATGDVFEVYMNQTKQGKPGWPKLSNLGLLPARNSKVDLGDFNGDGYSDLLYSGTIEGLGETTKLSEFNPTTKKYVDSKFNVSDVINAEVEFGDLDGDGDLDFAMSGENKANVGTYTFRTYVNVRNQSAKVAKQALSEMGVLSTGSANADIPLEYVENVVPSTPVVESQTVLTGITTAANTTPVEFVWKPSTDDHTPVEGLTYAVRVGTTPGGDDIMSPNANADGTRKTGDKGNAEHNLKWRLSLPDGTYYWSVQAVDASYAGSAFSEEKNFVLKASGIKTNNTPVVSSKEFSIREGAPKGTVVGKVLATDAENETLKFSLSTYQLTFEIDSLSGVIKVKDPAVLVYRNLPSLDLVVVVSDGVGKTNATIKINLFDLNKAPTSVKYAGPLVFSKDSPITDVTPEVNGFATKFKISPALPAGVKIDTTTGVINGTPTIEAAKATYTVTASNAGGSITGTVEIMVTRPNKVPVFGTNTFTLPENSKTGTVVGKITATDGDGDVMKYKVVTYGDVFEVDSLAGNLKVKNPAKLDFETTKKFTVSVAAYDGIATTVGDVTVNITDVNEGPRIDAVAPISVKEDLASATTLATLKAVDPEGATTITYSIAGGNADGIFELKNGNVLTLKTALDYETAKSHTLKIKSSDGSASDSTNVVINVLDIPNTSVEQAFKVNVYDVVYEDTKTKLDYRSFMRTEMAKASGFVYEISGGADAALFTIDPNTGTLNFKVAPDFENPTDANKDNIYEVIVKISNATDGAVEVPVVTSQKSLIVPEANPAPITQVAAIATKTATDTDGDGIADTIDNCPITANASQKDTDGDGQGDTCDDSDGDGIFDDVDKEIASAPGSVVDVYGVAMFSLPVSNYRVSSLSATCVGNNSGSFSVKVLNTSLVYTIKTTGPNSFTKSEDLDGTKSNTYTLGSLAKGTYNVCVTIAGKTGYEQCFEVTINEPAALKTNSVVDPIANSIKLDMSGASKYNVSINGETEVVYSNVFSKVLNTGLNKIVVTTDLACQGTFTREVFISEEVVTYPNPTTGIFHVNIPGRDTEVHVLVNSISLNTMLDQRVQIPVSRQVELDLTQMPMGTYVIQLVGESVRKTVKVVKQ